MYGMEHGNFWEYLYNRVKENHIVLIRVEDVWNMVKIGFGRLMKIFKLVSIQSWYLSKRSINKVLQ